ncbi:MAG TPA: hypothetical protein VJ732_18400, partial [Bryobacteraceae bacterium]|nr:hypothetical protein [Bryobacteraceae bacterium]
RTGFAWSPDSRRFAYSSGSARAHREIYIKSADGSGEAELVYKGSRDMGVLSWSGDGNSLLFFENNEKTATDLLILPLNAKRPEPSPMAYLQTQFTEAAAQFSPDSKSRWVTYISNESGTNEVYVQSNPRGGGKFQLSTGGARGPRWSRDGKKIFYNSPDATAVYEVTIKTEPKFEAELPRLAVRGGADAASLGTYPNFDVMPDGRLLMTAASDAAPAPKITVVVNWTAGLQK